MTARSTRPLRLYRRAMIPPPPPRWERVRAFTILEVMLAVGLLVLLTGGMYAFLWDLLSRREAVATEAARDQAAATLFERLETDLTGAVAGDEKQPGVVGTQSGITIRGRGVAMPLRAGERDSAMSDVQGTQVSFEGGVLRGRRWVGGGEPSGEFDEISADVQRVRFRYSDGREWRSSFSSATAGTLPVAVEVAVWFGGRDRGTEGQRDKVEEEASGQGGSEKAMQGEEVPAEAESSAVQAVPTREPDRRRLIVVPDGPAAAWKEGKR